MRKLPAVALALLLFVQYSSSEELADSSSTQSFHKPTFELPTYIKPPKKPAPHNQKLKTPPVDTKGSVKFPTFDLPTFIETPYISEPAENYVSKTSRGLWQEFMPIPPESVVQDHEVKEIPLPKAPSYNLPLDHHLHFIPVPEVEHKPKNKHKVVSDGKFHGLDYGAIQQSTTVPGAFNGLEYGEANAPKSEKSAFNGLDYAGLETNSPGGTTNFNGFEYGEVVQTGKKSATSLTIPPVNVVDAPPPSSPSPTDFNTNGNLKIEFPPPPPPPDAPDRLRWSDFQRYLPPPDPPVTDPFILDDDDETTKNTAHISGSSLVLYLLPLYLILVYYQSI